MPEETPLLARQPIFDQKLSIWGYELLFRSASDSLSDIGGDKATSEVLLNTFGEAGLKGVVGDHVALINFTRKLLLNLPPFDQNRYIIEVLENVEVDEDIITALMQAKKKGYKIALDDFILTHNTASLLHLTNIIKVDVLSSTREEIERYAHSFIPQKIELLAEKVETFEMFKFCKKLGFRYFQGYFLSKPEIISGKKIPDNKMVILKLLKELQMPSANPQKLSEIIAQDPQLSFKLLKIVNSAAFARVSKVNSLLQAVTVLGLNNIRSWASLIAMGTMEDKPEAIRLNAMVRAAMCEKLADWIQPDEKHSFFTAGLFANLDALFDQPLEELIKMLELPKNIATGIIAHKGPVGLALDIAMAFEQGDFDSMPEQLLTKHGLGPNELNEAYQYGIHWAENAISHT
jgi:EAL and modified HD-GYP domain-containing signal transduction protein